MGKPSVCYRGKDVAVLSISCSPLSTVILGPSYFCGAVTSQGDSQDENILCSLRNFLVITCPLLKLIGTMTTLLHFKNVVIVINYNNRSSKKKNISGIPSLCKMLGTKEHLKGQLGHTHARTHTHTYIHTHMHTQPAVQCGESNAGRLFHRGNAPGICDRRAAF